MTVLQPAFDSLSGICISQIVDVWPIALSQSPYRSQSALWRGYAYIIDVFSGSHCTPSAAMDMQVASYPARKQSNLCSHQIDFQLAGGTGRS